MMDGVLTDRGKIAHYDGDKWTEMVEDAGTRLNQLWASAPDDIYAVGGFNSDALILHYDGHAWTPVLADTSWELTSIWGRSASDVYAAGWGRVLHYDGSSWTQVASPPERPIFEGLFGTQDEIWLAADSGIVQLKNDQVSFALRWPMEWSVEAMSGCPGAEPFAVGFASQGGTKSLILRRQAGDWQPMSTSATSFLSGVWCIAPDDVYAVGENSTVLHYDGADWNSVALPTSPGMLGGVWGAAADEVFIVGEGGAVLRGAGDQWEALDTGTDAWLRAVWGTGPDDVFAAGDGVLLHYNGTVWTKEASGQFRGVWGADKDNIFAASQSSVLKREGTSWLQVHTPPYSSLGYPEYRAIFGSSASDFFAVGSSSTMTHFNGMSYETTTDFPVGLKSVWADGPGFALAAGGPFIMRYRCFP